MDAGTKSKKWMEFGVLTGLLVLTRILDNYSTYLVDPHLAKRSQLLGEASWLWLAKHVGRLSGFAHPSHLVHP